MVQPGDIVEIETAGGLAYLQVTHEHPSYPPAVRGLPGPHARRPDRPEALAAEAATFVALVPLENALAGIGAAYRVVGNAPVTPAAYPRFRIPVRDKAGAVIYWWIWDGRGLSHVTELGPEDAALPLRTVIGGAELMRRLTGARTEGGPGA